MAIDNKETFADAVANSVKGNYGNNPQRQQALGADYERIQNTVNDFYKTKQKPNWQSIYDYAVQQYQNQTPEAPVAPPAEIPVANQNEDENPTPNASPQISQDELANLANPTLKQETPTITPGNVGDTGSDNPWGSSILDFIGNLFKNNGGNNG